MHQGSWGLPDFGLTELLQSIINPRKAYASTGGSNLIGGSQTGLTTDQPDSQGRTFDTTLNSLLGGSTLDGGGTTPPPPTGGGTGGGTGRTVPGAPVGGGDAGADLALQAWNAAKQQANDIRSRGQETFDTILKSIAAYRDRSKSLFDNAGQEITNNASNILGTNANNAQQLVGKATGQARSLGLGLSSRLGTGQNILNNLGTTQGGVLAKRGEQNRSNTVDYQGKIANADTQEADAGTYLKGVNDSANAVESGGVNNYGSALNNVLNYQRMLASINPLQADSVKEYAPDFSGIVNTLNTILGGGTPTVATAPNGGAVAATSANPVSTTNILDLLKKQQGLYTA